MAARRTLPRTSVYVDVPPLSRSSSSVRPTPTKEPAPGATPNSTSRFKKQLYIEIPHSPLWLSSRSKISTSNAAKASRTEKSAPQSGMEARPGPLKDANKLATLSTAHIDLAKKRKSVEGDDIKAAKRQRTLDIIAPTLPKGKRGRPPKGSLASTMSLGGTATAVEGAFVQPAPKRAKKVPEAPEPAWNKIDTELTRREVEDRMMLREFVHRFSVPFKIAKAHRDALDDFDTLSNQAAKSIIVALLDILADDTDDDALEDEVVAVRNRVRSLPPDQLEEIWEALDSLRQSHPTLQIQPPSVDTAVDSTVDETDEAPITSATQMMPVLLSLVEMVLQGPSVRYELELGVQEIAKEKSKASTQIKQEKDKWASQKKKLMDHRDAELEKAKAALAVPGAEKPEPPSFDQKAWKEELRTQEAKHLSTVRRQQTKLAQLLAGYKLRSLPAGMDFDGRTYYVLALPPQGVRLPPEDDRAGFRKWAWFVAVWGKASQSGINPGSRSPDSITDAEEAWYGFSDPDEIHKLVKWLEWRKYQHVGERGWSGSGRSSMASNSTHSLRLSTGAKDTDGPSPDIKALCKTLTDFADFLQWRLNA